MTKTILYYYCKGKANLNTDDCINLLISTLYSRVTFIRPLNSQSRQVIERSCCEVQKPNSGSLLHNLKEKKILVTKYLTL